MCYVKPGPRCAAHLTGRIERLEDKVDRLSAQAFDKGATKAQERRILRYRTQLEVARFEYDGTKTGQEHLDARISAATNLNERRALSQHKQMARKSREDKLAAYHRNQKRLADMTDTGFAKLLSKLDDTSLSVADRRKVQGRINCAKSLRYQKGHSDSINAMSKADRTKDRISKLFVNGDNLASTRSVGLAAS